VQLQPILKLGPRRGWVDSPKARPFYPQ